MISPALVLIGIIVLYLFWYRLNRLLFQDVFSPFHLLFFFWVMPLLLRTMALSSLESPWGLPTILILLWVTAVLVFTSLMFSFDIRKGGKFKQRQNLFEKLLALTRTKNFRIILASIWIGVFVIYLYAEIITNPYGIPVLALLQGKLSGGSSVHRWGKDNSPFTAITSLLFIITPLLYLTFRGSKNTKSKWFFFILAVLYPVIGFLKLSRSDIYISALNIGMVEYYYWKYRGKSFSLSITNLVRVTVLLSVVMGLLFVTLHIRGGSAEVGWYAHAIGFKIKSTHPLVEIAAQVYGYAALPFENFHRFFSSYQGGFNPGISVLRPFLSVLGMGDVADRMLQSIPFGTAVSSAAGSATFVTPIYAEFGLPGLLIVPLVYGLLVNVLYFLFRVRPNFLNFFVYINFVYPWTWLYFNNAFSPLSFYINSAFVVFLSIIFRKIIMTRRRAETSLHPEGQPG